MVLPASLIEKYALNSLSPFAFIDPRFSSVSQRFLQGVAVAVHVFLVLRGSTFSDLCTDLLSDDLFLFSIVYNKQPFIHRLDI